MDSSTNTWERFLVRIGIYGLALVIDMILSGVLFVIELRAAELTHSAMIAGSIFATWSAVYFVASLCVGPAVRPGNAARLMLMACAGLALTSVGYVYWPGLKPMFIWTALNGVASALFFTPFQLFMKLVDEGQNKGLSRSSGLYVFSWSVGYALGPLVVGLLWRYGWSACHAFNALAALMTALGIFTLRHHAHRAPTPAAGCPTDEPVIDDIHLPDLAWMAWVFSGLGCMMACLLRSQFPNAALAYHISEPAQGAIFFLFSGTQAVVGLLLGWTKHWMYRPWPIFGFGLAGVVGLGLFAAGTRVPLLTLAGCSLGVYTGSMYFYFVYHSLIHPTRAARYVSINEAVVGVAGVAGPALGGVLADRLNLWMPYAVGSAMLFIAISIQSALHARQRGAVV